jgi:Tyrosine phosphatase family
MIRGAPPYACKKKPLTSAILSLSRRWQRRDLRQRLQEDRVTSERIGQQRRLALAGAVNFRDLGGYDVGFGRQTSWGKLWRSDSLADLTEDDFRLLEPLGLSTLIDFRLPMERDRKPNRLPPGSAIETVEIGFVPEGTLDMLRGVSRHARCVRNRADARQTLCELRDRA